MGFFRYFGPAANAASGLVQGNAQGQVDAAQQARQLAIAQADRQAKAQAAQQAQANADRTFMLDRRRVEVAERPDTVRPTPKQKIVGQDGAVQFVDPENPPPNLREHVSQPAPREPRNIDPLSTPGIAAAVVRDKALQAARPAERQHPTLRAGRLTLKNVDDQLNRYGALLNELGPKSNPLDPSTYQLKSAYKATTIQLKELFKLGVLAGPDMELIEGSLGDPIGPTAMMPGRKEGLQLQLVELQGVLARAKAALEEIYGSAAPASVPLSPSSGASFVRKQRP